jgi:large subunit ribosomal protein L24
MARPKRAKLRVRRGDVVEVVAGNARGSRGRVLGVVPRHGRVLVEGVNMVWKHLPRSRQNPSGGRIQVEAPIDASNVMLLCPNRDCTRYDRPVRVRTALADGGRKQRVCAKCGAEIPKVE